MNHSNRVSSKDPESSQGAAHYPTERLQSNLDPQLDNIHGSQFEMPEAVYPSAISGNTLHTLSTETSIGVDGQAQFIGEPFSTLTGDLDEVSPLAGNNLWGSSLMSIGPAWLTDYDFDLEALNTSVSAAVETAEPLFQSHMNRNLAQQMPPSEVTHDNEVRRNMRVANDNIHRGWFSHIDRLNDEDDNSGVTTGQLTPVITGDQYDIGDSFHHRVYQRLKARSIEEPLPSTQFLNLSVQIYFTKFNTIFPLIHGSLILGSKAAAAQGIRIFERLNKAILGSWEKIISSDSTEAVCMVQAAVVGQTFALLSGIPQHLAIVEALHGSVITWARRCHMFNYRINQPQVENLSGASLDEAWKAWARSEEIVRAVLGLYIHDAKLACMFHHEPLLRHNSIMMSVAADDDLFNAPSATIWKRKMLQSASRSAVRDCLHMNLDHHGTQPVPQELSWKNSHFTAYIILHGISATINEQQQMSQLHPDSANFTKCFDALICWYQTFAQDAHLSESKEVSRPDTLCLMILWHSVFMCLLTNFDLLERAIGRNGADSATLDTDMAYATKWATSREAQRCMLHVHALLNSLGAMRLDAEAAIHVPHCLFLAGIVSYCFTRFRRPNPALQSPAHTRLSRLETRSPALQPVVEFPEFEVRGVPIPQHIFGSPSINSNDHVSPLTHDGTSNSFTIHGDQTTRFRATSGAGAAMMCTLIDMLQRVGHWGIARTYAATLSTLVCVDSDEDWKFILSGY
ncbi:hypothetical protein V501_05921 [Pseudogymnoascus sp. VKM F-4519 (FW-2642)]|nr:hypothetical protein V501_05921 [Pseudogymnoascus sp. VKM F-4519 (FW-2642)]